MNLPAMFASTIAHHLTSPLQNTETLQSMLKDAVSENGKVRKNHFFLPLVSNSGCCCRSFA